MGGEEGACWHIDDIRFPDHIHHHHDVIRTHMVVVLLWRRATICAMSHENEFLRSKLRDKYSN